MRCKEFNGLLNAFPQHERTWQDRIKMDRHRAGCVRCAGVWQAEQMLRGLIIPPLPQTLLNRIADLVDEIANGSALPFRSGRTIVIASLFLTGITAAAAAVLALRDRTDDFSDSEPETAVATPAPATVLIGNDTRAGDAEAFPLVEIADDGGSANAPQEQAPARPLRIDPIVVDAPPETAANVDNAVPEEHAANEPSETSPRAMPGVLDTIALIEEFLAVADSAAASELGEALLERVRAEFGDASVELADSQLLLARTFSVQVAHQEARRLLVSTARLLESMENVPPMQLVDLWLRLGESYAAINEHLSALSSHERARDLIHRERGLQTPDEVAILRRMTDWYLALGAVAQAHETQSDALRIARLAYGNSAYETLEAHWYYARWLRDYGVRSDATAREIGVVYADAHSLIRQHFLDDDPRDGIRLLKSHADRMLEGGMDWGIGALTALRSLLDARNLYDSSGLDDPLLNASLKLAIGDWCVLAGNMTRIDRAYRDAWELLEGHPDAEAIRDEWFSGLTILNVPWIDSRSLSSDADAPWARVEIALTVDSRGRTRSPRIVASDPPGLLDGVALRRVAASRFRPRVVDGRIEQSEQRIEWNIQYDPQRLRNGPGSPTTTE